MKNVLSDELSSNSTEELKDKLLQLTQGRDTEPLAKKVLFYKKELKPIFEEMSRRNPLPTVEEQVRIIPGVWVPTWSTIPFQDSLPGRLRDQSYQIFHDNGYYANMARYAPGSKLTWLRKFAGFLLAYDFMILQKFEVKNGHWFIQNIGIEQAFRLRGVPLSIDRAERWFTAASKSKLKTFRTNSPEVPLLGNLDKSIAKKFKKIASAIPQLEHLYMDQDFRLVKTQREANQRPSYTIAVRKRSNYQLQSNTP